MSKILFESFVSVVFEQHLGELQKFDFKEESGRLAVYYFIKSWTAEKKIFGERYQELENQYSELKKDKSEKEIEALQIEQMSKLSQLLKCESHLKSLDYEKVKEGILNPLKLEMLTPVLINIPIE